MFYIESYGHFSAFRASAIEVTSSNNIRVLAVERTT